MKKSSSACVQDNEVHSEQVPIMGFLRAPAVRISSTGFGPPAIGFFLLQTKQKQTIARFPYLRHDQGYLRIRPDDASVDCFWSPLFF